MSIAERRRVDAGGTLVRTLPGRDGDVVVFGTRRISADGDRLTAWVRQVDQLKASTLVAGIGRLSEPPTPGDLDALTLDDDDLEAIRRCRPSDCGVKLTASEIRALQHEIALAGTTWKPRLQQGFRAIILARLRAYLASGHGGLGQYDDGRSPASLATAFSSVLERSTCVTDWVPLLTPYLADYPRVSPVPFETFFYWSKEKFGTKSIVSVTHVVILRGGANGEDAIVAGKQVFATHYLNGSLNLTAIVGGGPGRLHYLVVLNRSNVDVLEGMFAGVTRMVLGRRLRSEVSQILQQLGQRLESGLPRSGSDSRE